MFDGEVTGADSLLGALAGRGVGRGELVGAFDDPPELPPFPPDDERLGGWGSGRGLGREFEEPLSPPPPPLPPPDDPNAICGWSIEIRNIMLSVCLELCFEIHNHDL